VLNVLAVRLDERGGQLDKLGAQEGEELGPDEVLDGLLFLGLGVDVDVELGDKSDAWFF
jgi:hypothetical protein